MRNLSYLIIILSLGIFSCRTPRYVNAPAAVNAPNLQKAGDNKLAAYYSSNFGNSNETAGNQYNKSKGYDLQAAYAISNHWAIQANYLNRSDKNGGINGSSFDSSVVQYNRKAGDIGIGYFTKISKRGSNFFQVFAGAGKGKYEIKDAGLIASIPYNRFHNATINKYYIQPALIFSDKNISLGLVSRFSFVHYNKVETNYTTPQQSEFNLADLENKLLSFWEPAITFSAGTNSIPALKLEFQLGASLSIDNNYYDVKTGNASIGLIMDFSKLRNKE